MKIDRIICELVEYAAVHKLIEEEDRAYATSSLMKALSLDALEFYNVTELRPLADILADICTYEAMCLPQVHKVLRIRSTTTVGGRLVIDMDVSMNFPCKVSTAAQEVSDRVKKAIENYTSITVRHIHVNVKSLEIK